MDTILEILILYHEEDKQWYKELETHLRSLQRAKRISTWSPYQIGAGQERQEVRNTHFNNASIILLLISPDFMASETNYDEMQQAMQRYKDGKARVIPIKLKTVEHWQNTPFGELKALPDDGKPLVGRGRNDRNEAWVKVVEEISDLPEIGKTPSVRSSEITFTRFHNLPFQRNPHFTGREEYLELLDQHFKQNQSVAVTSMSGLGGIGKTQLALEYAYRCYRNKKYRTVLWVKAANQETLEKSYLELAHLLQLPEKNNPEADYIVQAVKMWLEDHEGWLLILDNADDPDLARSFLPIKHHGHILLTTRSQIVSHFAKRIKIEVMRREEAVSFLLQRSTHTTEADTHLSSVREAAVRLAQLLGDLPLALDQAGAYVEETGISFDNYIQKYHQYRSGLLDRYGPLDTEHLEHPETVVVTFEISLQGACESCPVAADVLRFCSYLHPDDIPEELLSLDTRLGLSPLLFDKAIAALHRYSLIKRHAEKRLLSIHRLVQAVVQDMLLEQERKVWTTRVISVMHQAFPRNIEYDTWNQCERYLPHALACTRSGEQGHLTPLEEAQLLNRVGSYLRERARYKEAEALLRRAVAIARDGGPVAYPVLCHSLHELAHNAFRQGSFKEAEVLYEQGLEIRQQQPHLATSSIADSLDMIATLNGLADTCRALGKPEKALVSFQQAYAIYESLPGIEHARIANLLSNWGLCYLDIGNYEKAEPLLQRALALSEKLLSAGDPTITYSLNTLAGLYVKLGTYKQAESLFLQALEIDMKAHGPNHPTVAEDLSNLAETYRKWGQYEEAASRLQQALAIQEEKLGPQHPNTAATLNLLGLVYLELGDAKKAEPLLQRALAIREHQLGPYHPSTAITLHNLGSLSVHIGRYEEARLLFQQALAIKEQQVIQEPSGIAQSLNSLGGVYYMQGKYVAAEPLWLRALQIREKNLGPRHPDTAESLTNLAHLRQVQGKYGEAEPLLKRALTISEEALGAKHPRALQIQEDYTALMQAMKPLSASPKTNRQREIARQKAKSKMTKQSRKKNQRK